MDEKVFFHILHKGYPFDVLTSHRLACPYSSSILARISTTLLVQISIKVEKVQFGTAFHEISIHVIAQRAADLPDEVSPVQVVIVVFLVL